MLSLAAEVRAALDPAAFATDLLGFNLDEWQTRVLRWRGQRLLLNCCRQSGKSTIAGMLALHRSVFYPNSLVLLVSPSLRQSGELFRKVTDLAARLDVRPQRVEDNRLSCALSNGSRVVSLPGTEATVRGFSAVDLVIEDEASRVSDDLYVACRPMLAVSGGRYVLLSTPWGKRGHFHAEWTEGGASWERVLITARDCPRIPPAFLEEERRSLGDMFFRSEYLCEFVETIDSVFAYDDIYAALETTMTPLFAEVAHG